MKRLATRFDLVFKDLLVNQPAVFREYQRVVSSFRFLSSCSNSGGGSRGGQAVKLAGRNPDMKRRCGTAFRRSTMFNLKTARHFPIHVARRHATGKGSLCQSIYRYCMRDRCRIVAGRVGEDRRQKSRHSSERKAAPRLTETPRRLGVPVWRPRYTPRRRRRCRWPSSVR